MTAILPCSSDARFARAGKCAPAVLPVERHRIGSRERSASVLSYVYPQTGLSRRAALVAVAGLFCSVAQADTPMRSDAEQLVPFGGSHRLIDIARRDLGKSGPQMGLPSRLWCGLAANRWRRAAGLSAPKSGLAFDHVRHGKRISRPVVGALLVQGRRGGGHVSIITEIHANGTVTAISGNDSARVRERVRSARGIILLPH